MVDGKPGRVFLDQDEGRAVDRGGILDAESLGDGADEVRLAGAERADEADDGTREEQRPEPPAERLGAVEVGDVDRALHGNRRGARSQGRE